MIPTRFGLRFLIFIVGLKLKFCHSLGLKFNILFAQRLAPYAKVLSRFYDAIPRL